MLRWQWGVCAKSPSPIDCNQNPGALSGIDREALTFAFEVAREGTCVAEARLDLEIVEGTLTCRDCGQTMSAESPPEACPGCGSLNLRLDGAAGLDVVSLEVD